MQRIWSRSAAPTPHCISCLSNTVEEAASRIVPTTSMRSLRIKNSSTARYTAVLAAAASTDARANSRHRQRLQERIADVKEVNELYNEGRCFLDPLSPRRATNPSRTALQARQIHTLPRSTHRPIQSSITQAPCRLSHSSSDVAFDGTEPADPIIKELEAEKLAPIEEADGDFDMAVDVEDVPDWLNADLIRAKAIKKLALKQLAIRLVLRPVIAHSYFGVLKNYDPDDSTPEIDLRGLLFELNAIRRRIRQIKSNPSANVDDLVRGMNIGRLKATDYHSQRPSRRVSEDTSLYLANEMSLKEYLLKLSSNLLDIQDPDQPHVFSKMILAFTKTRQNDLAELVIKTILPYKCQMNVALITAILVFFRKSKDLNGFDLFLKMLEGKGYPIELGRLSPYKSMVVNGIKISVPPVHSANIVIYGVLIKACLRFDQPDRADAYLMVARGAGNLDDFGILSAYLGFYAVRGSWEKGLPLLQRTLAFIASTTQHPLYRVERLVWLMIHLCDSCHMFDASEALIEAAVDSGFSADLPDKQTDIVSEIDPESHRWRAAVEKSTPKRNQTADGYLDFVKTAGDYLDTLAIPEEETSPRRLHRLSEIYSRRVLTSVVEGRLAGKVTQEKTMLEQGSDGGVLETNQMESENVSISLENTVTAQQHEIVTLRSEVAQLKKMVLRLYQSTTGPSIHTTSDSKDPNGLMEGIATSAPASSETPQNERVDNVGS